MVKGKVFPVHAITAYRWSKGIAPLIFTLALDGGECLTSHPDWFMPWKEPWYPLNRRLCRLQSHPGLLGKRNG